MLFVARVGRRNLLQQLLPILGEGSNIIVISSLGARAVLARPIVWCLRLLMYGSHAALRVDCRQLGSYGRSRPTYR